jgi:hypothetical protein
MLLDREFELPWSNASTARLKISLHSLFGFQYATPMLFLFNENLFLCVMGTENIARDSRFDQLNFWESCIFGIPFVLSTNAGQSQKLNSIDTWSLILAKKLGLTPKKS